MSQLQLVGYQGHEPDPHALDKWACACLLSRCLVQSFSGRERNLVPISVEILDDQKLVIARVTGVMTGEDMLNYQVDTWSKRSVVGYDEIVDVTSVESFDYKGPSKIKEVTHISARMDWANFSRKMAIVAVSDMATGMARMYQSYRDNETIGRKEIMIFKTMEQARQWLGR